jgi:hypothetical protein
VTAKVIGVHGAFHELWGPHQVAARWLPALRDGLWLADGPTLDDDDFSVAFYGDLFRHDPAVGPSPRTVEEVLDQHRLGQLLDGATAQALVAGLQHALGDVLTVQLFDTIARYVAEPELRVAVAARLEARVTPSARVLVAHSLGSVIAYEALCAHPEWPIRTFVTIGSPLGAPRVLGALRPAPVDGRGAWPGSVTT